MVISLPFLYYRGGLMMGGAVLEIILPRVVASVDVLGTTRSFAYQRGFRFLLNSQN